MVTFSAYFDESGTSDPSPILVVAGFLSTDRQWNRFDAEWKGMLDRAMPAVRHEQRHFHLMHWRRRRKQFEGWTPGKCHRIAAQACTIVKNRTRHCVAAGVNRADHKRLGIPFHGISGPYAFCAIRCLE